MTNNNVLSQLFRKSMSKFSQLHFLLMFYEVCKHVRLTHV